MRKRKSDFQDSFATNQQTYFDYYNRICEMALSCFTWKNLPSTCDARYLELSLLLKGNCAFFKDEVIGYLTLPSTVNGNLDVYGYPINFTAYANNGYQMQLSKDNAVIIYNNNLKTNVTIDLINFAKRLYNIDRTIDINVNSQKTPLIIKGNEKEMLALKNVYQKWEGNQPVIFADKNQILGEEMQCLKTDAPYISDKLWELKVNIWNEIYTYLGISNMSEKKERLVTDEVTRTLGGVFINREIRLNARKKGSEKINEMFGLNVDVEFSGDSLATDVQTPSEEVMNRLNSREVGVDNE